MKVLTAVIVLAAACVAAPTAGAAPTEGGTSRAAAPGLARLDVPRQLRVVSYYPADAGWTRMWEPWRPDRLAADLRRLRTLNANAVRVVVPPRLFGYPEPEVRYLDRLREVVAIAAREDLRVQLTLFDWWDAYGDLAGSKRWTRAVLAPYAGDPRIVFVELRNEIDPADPAAMAWARELVPWTRALLRDRTPITLSVAGESPLRDLRALRRALPGASRPDFFAAHSFTGGAEAAGELFRRLRDAVAPTPLWLGEVGYPTSRTVSGYEGVPLTPSAQEAAQAHYFRLSFAALRRHGLPDPGLWILDDFLPGAIPESDVSPREPEYAFGLFRADGSAKPAAATVRRLFRGEGETGFNGGFEQLVAAADGSPWPGTWALVGLEGLEVVRDGRVARSGTASVRIASRGAAGSAVLAVAPVAGVPEPGQRAHLTAWVRGSVAAGRVRLSVHWSDAGGRRVGAASRTARPLVRDWQQVSVSARAPAGAAFARIVVEASGFAGAVWVDDVAYR